MKIIHVPFCFAPDPVGGTEIYVATLARDLLRHGLEVVIAAPANTNQTYMVDDLKVWRFATHSNITDVSELYGAGDRLAAAEFAKILDNEKPDIVHLHAFTPAVSLRLVRAAKSRGIKVVLTYHTPTVSCQRGTLMLWGDTLCDGRLDIHRCAACTLNALGMDRRVATIVGRVPPILGDWLRHRGLQGGAWTALRMSELITMRCTTFRKMMFEVDHVVAVCDWVRDLLLRNDIPPAKLFVSRHGISWVNDGLPASRPRPRGEEVRVAFVGRMDPTKGLGVLIDALRMVPKLRIRLDVYGVAQGASGAAYTKEMRALAADDSRVNFLGPLPSQAVVGRLREYDFLAVPSQWLETGPMVVLEAFAAGIPVIGWNLGGTAEIVRDGIDGLLIAPGPKATERWAEAFRLVTESDDLRERLKAGVRPPRGSENVAQDMLTLYDSIL